MRSLSSSLVVILGGALVAAVIAAGCSTPNGAGGAAGASRGERFFKTKCNSCHPNGGQGAGPPIDASLAPDFLERGKTSGRHAVPEGDWEPLLAYIGTTFGDGTAIAVAPADPVVAPVGTTPVAVVAPPVGTAPVAVAAAGDPAAGGVYFQTKCAKCHPGGAKIAGRTIPGVLVAGGPGKHGVPGGDFDNVLSYLTTLGAVRSAGAVAVAPVATQPVAVAVAVAPSASSGDAAAGGAYFQTKCAKCHPGGAKIAGKAIPGALVENGAGKHGVPSQHFENMLAYLVTIGAVRAGGAPVAAAPTGVPVTTTAPPPPPPPTDGTIPMNAGMVPCSCACQCPAGAPPEALPAACLCQCSCPR